MYRPTEMQPYPGDLGSIADPRSLYHPEHSALSRPDPLFLVKCANEHTSPQVPGRAKNFAYRPTQPLPYNERTWASMQVGEAHRLPQQSISPPSPQHQAYLQRTVRKSQRHVPTPQALIRERTGAFSLSGPAVAAFDFLSPAQGTSTYSHALSAAPNIFFEGQGGALAAPLGFFAPPELAQRGSHAVGPPLTFDFGTALGAPPAGSSFSPSPCGPLLVVSGQSWPHIASSDSRRGSAAPEFNHVDVVPHPVKGESWSETVLPIFNSSERHTSDIDALLASFPESAFTCPPESVTRAKPPFVCTNNHIDPAPVLAPAPVNTLPSAVEHHLGKRHRGGSDETVFPPNVSDWHAETEQLFAPPSTGSFPACAQLMSERLTVDIGQSVFIPFNEANARHLPFEAGQDVNSHAEPGGQFSNSLIQNIHGPWTDPTHGQAARAKPDHAVPQDLALPVTVGGLHYHSPFANQQWDAPHFSMYSSSGAVTHPGTTGQASFPPRPPSPRPMAPYQQEGAAPSVILPPPPVAPLSPRPTFSPRILTIDIQPDAPDVLQPSSSSRMAVKEADFNAGWERAMQRRAERRRESEAGM